MTKRRYARGPKRVHLVYLSDVTIPIVTACGRQILKQGRMLTTDDLEQASCNQCTSTALSNLAGGTRVSWAMENYHYRKMPARRAP